MTRCVCESRFRRIAEMIRRLVLVGVMVVVYRGSMMQLTIGCVFSVAYLCVDAIRYPLPLQTRAERSRVASRICAGCCSC
jgi:hypothetical protein